MKTELTPSLNSAVIQMAWADRVTFDEIREKTGLTESQVIDIMRRELKASSFRLWRQRVSGRITKHRQRMRSLKVRQPSHLELISD